MWADPGTFQKVMLRLLGPQPRGFPRQWAGGAGLHFTRVRVLVLNDTISFWTPAVGRRRPVSGRTPGRTAAPTEPAPGPPQLLQGPPGGGGLPPADWWVEGRQERRLLARGRTGVGGSAPQGRGAGRCGRGLPGGPRRPARGQGWPARGVWGHGRCTPCRVLGLRARPGCVSRCPAPCFLSFGMRFSGTQGKSVGARAPAPRTPCGEQGHGTRV